MKYSAILFLFGCLWIGTEVIAHEAQSLYLDTVRVEVKGTSEDARFEPAVVNVNPGDVLQFVVREGRHTVTAYHPDNRRPLRMPVSAKSFDSGLLRRGDVWFLTISLAGVYDYYCLPHERMGHAGRIIAGSVDAVPVYPKENIPEAVLQKITANPSTF